jgi:F0F1-type ATP synthase membrane subunit b/b'
MFEKQIAEFEAKADQIVRNAEERLNTIAQDLLDRVNGTTIDVTAKINVPPRKEGS